MNFDTHDLKLFTAAAELGSLTAASNYHHLALAAVSKRISKLEEQIGQTLFIRNKNGVILTSAGKVFFRYAKNWLYDTQTLSSELQKHQRNFHGLIRIAANTNAMLGFIPEYLGQFLTQHHHVDIRIEEALSSTVVKRVMERHADIGIFEASVETGNLELFPFYDDRLVLVMAVHHHLAQSKGLYFEEVLNEDFIALEERAPIQVFLHTQAKHINKTMHTRVQTRSFDAICRFAQHGFGVGIVPQSAVLHFENTKMPLALVPLLDKWAYRSLKIAVYSLEVMPEYAQALVHHLSQLSEHQDN